MVTVLAGQVPSRRSRTAHGHLFRTWMVAVTAGEFVGFCAPALAGALVIGSPSALALPVLVAAGAVEGAVLGLSQALVMRRALPDLALKGWVAATAAGAAAAWLLGLLPSTTHQLWSRWPLPLAVVTAVLLAGLLLCSLGIAQWWVLRRHVAHAGTWVWGTAVAWALGLVAFSAVTTPLWQPGQAQRVVVAIGAVGGLAMAATMAATSGLVLLYVLEGRPGSVGLRVQARVVNPLVGAVLSSSMHRVLSESTVLLTYSGWRSGRHHTVPVMYAEDGTDLVIVAGAHHKKVWWRNFTRPSDVEVVLRGERCRARARRVMLFDAAYEHDLGVYRRRYPHARVSVGAPVIRVRLDTASARKPHA